MSPLKEKILRLIRAQGPISVAQYMQIALGDPEHGYYMRRDPLGRDFVTAPEVSQIFGELIGLLFVQAWADRGRPKRFHLVELGPGRGTLMADMLRAAKIRPAFLDAAEISLVEMSPTLRSVQAKTLEGARVQWRNELGEVPSDAPLFLVANEFFDALPARQFVRAERGWHERMVTAGDDALAFALAPEPVPNDVIAAQLRSESVDLRPLRHASHATSPASGGGKRSAMFPYPLAGEGAQSVPLGAVFESSPASQAVVNDIAHRIVEQSGVALIIDYGHVAAGFGDTFQAVKDNRYADPLAEPGEADLTFHVDFAALAGAALEAGAHVCGPQTQGAFLQALGIEARAIRLKQAAADQVQAIDAALERLTSPAQMGSLFKAMAICESRDPGVPGFSC